MDILIKQHMLNPYTWPKNGTAGVDMERVQWFHDQMEALAKLVDIAFAPDNQDAWPELISHDWAKIVVFGEHRCQAPEFINVVYEHEKEILLCERAPLMKNGRCCLYFDEHHLSYNGNFSCKEKWASILSLALTKEEQNAVTRYRDTMHGNTAGIETQQAPFVTRNALIAKLGIKRDKKLIYMPLQVDEDAVIRDKRLSPWIDSMQEFVDVVLKSWQYTSKEFVLLIKRHPYGEEVRVPKTERVFYLENEINANSLVEASDVVLSINSGSGMEALVFHKKLITLGKSFYSDKNINWEADSIRGLANLLNNISKSEPDGEAIDRFLYHFIFKCLYDFTDEKDFERWKRTYLTGLATGVQ